jgi:HSP20 family molecular chaperone IbpA
MIRKNTMAEKTIETPETQREIRTAEGTRTRERDMTPPVDIYETPADLVVMADLPGVAKEDLEVRVENNLLTIRGHARHTAPGTPVYREYEAGHFFRQFEVTGKIDTAKITAEFKHGVLVLHLPKAAEAKPRKIEVAVAV